ncbi:hypothetical protein Lal_00043016 [Lupinus albus]|nr:hypothetical protein Lal_00043016 [Lupinus albus]
MSAPKCQRTESGSLPGIGTSSAISNSLLGLARFAERGITPSYTNLSWMTESGFIFPELLRYKGVQASALVVEYRIIFTLLAYCLVPRHTNHNEPTVDDLFLMFAIRERQRIDWPTLILLYMLEFSMETSGSLGYPLLISQIIEHALVDVSDTPFLMTNISQHFLLGTYIYHHLDICAIDGVWTYFEDINASRVGTVLPPPADDSNEDTIVHPFHYHALDEVEDDDEEDP